MKIISWNVNGIRAVHKKGFPEWFKEEAADIVCLQEIKASVEQLDDSIKSIEGYSSYWNPARRKGYSGVATFVKGQALSCEKGLGLEEFDTEGRVIITKHENFSLLNIYFPNGQMGEERIKYKLEFYREVIRFCETLRKTQPKLIICGDFNTAHNEIDLKNPKANEKTSGFLPVEREMLDKFLSYGYIDVFRHFYPDKIQYSWWSYRTRARERNAGWRIDYFYVSQEMLGDILDCEILDNVQGSDHCPIALYL